MTSNIGSQMIQQIAEEGGGAEEMRASVKESLQTRFLPEFLNRIDETIVFHPLTRKEIRTIVEIQTRGLANQLEQQGITLHVTEAAQDAIANEGYDPSYGARPLKRVIQQRLQNPLATEILKGNVAEGGTLTIDAPNGEFTFENVPANTSSVETVGVS